MSVCELHCVTLYDTDAVCTLIYELKQGQFNLQASSAGYAANLQDPNMHYQSTQFDGQVVDLIGLHLQLHPHRTNWIDEVQELVMIPQAWGLTVGSQLLTQAEVTAYKANAKVTGLSTNTRYFSAYRFYQREGYTQSHFRFIKSLQGEP